MVAGWGGPFIASLGRDSPVALCPQAGLTSLGLSVPDATGGAG